MLLKVYLVAVLSLLGCSISYAGESDVLVLTDTDFDTILANHQNVLVMFYAPWCGHCKRLKPEFDKAAELVTDDDPPIKFAKVDCTEAGKETCSKFSVSGYPTLKIFRSGDLSSEYNGPREAAGIVKYMRSQVGPSAKEVKTVDEFKTFIGKDDAGVVAFLAADSKLESVFLKVADKLREKSRFAHTNVADVIKGASQKEDTLVLYRPKLFANKFEPDFVVYKGAFDKDAIETFINKEYYGLVGVRTQDNAKDFLNPLVTAYYAVDYKKNPKGTNYWRNRILKVAQDFKDDFTFAVSSKDDFQHDLNEFGIDYVPSEKPIISAKNTEGRKFLMSGEFTVELFTQFLKDLKAGKLEPFLKSEDIPAHQEGAVIVAVGKNFDEVVTNNGKDTLIEFYAPWCGHCKKLTPIYEEVAQKLKEEDVAIIKVDATANDVPPRFEVRGFPTLFWIPKSSSPEDKPVKYEGGREVDDFIKYIAKHATNELKGYDRSGKPKKTEL